MNNPSKEQNYAMLKWLNNNRQKVIELYKNQYIAYNEKGVISHSENLTDVLQLAKISGETFLIYLVPAKSHYVQILPITFRDKIP